MASNWMKRLQLKMKKGRRKAYLNKPPAPHYDSGARAAYHSTTGKMLIVEHYPEKEPPLQPRHVRPTEFLSKQKQEDENEYLSKVGISIRRDRYGVPIRKFDNTFMQLDNKARAVSETVFVDNPAIKADNKAFDLQQGARQQKLNEFIRGPCISIDGPIKVFYYFSGTKCYLRQEGQTFWARSKVYDSRDECLAFFQRGLTHWMQFVPLDE